MCVPLAAAVIGSAVLGAGAAVYSASKQSSAARAAMQQNERIAAQQAQASETAFNRANQKMPDIAAMASRARMDMSQGVGATFLTGSGGAPVSQGMLGRATLLGG